MADGHRVDPVDGGCCDSKGFLKNWPQSFEVGAAGDLGNHPRKSLVQFVLGGNDVRPHPKTVFNHGPSCLVATGFDPENEAHGCLSST